MGNDCDCVFVAMMSILPFYCQKKKCHYQTFRLNRTRNCRAKEIVRGGSSDTEFVATVTDQIDAKEDDALGFRYHGSNNIWIRFDK